VWSKRNPLWNAARQELVLLRGVPQDPFGEDSRTGMSYRTPTETHAAPRSATDQPSFASPLPGCSRQAAAAVQLTSATPNGCGCRARVAAAQNRPVGAVGRRKEHRAEATPNGGSSRVSFREAATLRVYLGCRDRQRLSSQHPGLPRWRSALAGVGSNTGWRSASAAKSSTGEFLAAWKYGARRGRADESLQDGPGLIGAIACPPCRECAGRCWWPRRHGRAFPSGRGCPLSAGPARLRAPGWMVRGEFLSGYRVSA
jgi:hypothetical protein